MRAVGCTSHAPENGDDFEDDVAFHAWLKELDFGDEAMLARQLARFGGAGRLPSWPSDPRRPVSGRDTMTATTTDHVTIISDLYAAFGRGDLPLATFQVHDFRVLDLLASQTQVVAQIVIDKTYPSGPDVTRPEQRGVRQPGRWVTRLGRLTGARGGSGGHCA